MNKSLDPNKVVVLIQIIEQALKTSDSYKLGITDLSTAELVELKKHFNFKEDFVNSNISAYIVTKKNDKDDSKNNIRSN